MECLYGSGSRDQSIWAIDYASLFKPKAKGMLKSDIKQVIYNNPATIVYFTDGSKVVVKTMDGDEFNDINF